jgi:hypothetical protein
MAVHIAAGGEFLQLKGERVAGAQPERDYSRGPVFGFSWRSRRRLFDFFAKLDRRAPGPELLVTLTYSDKSHGLSWQVWKSHLQAMVKRLKRRYPGIAFMWRLELKPRQTGDHVGELMPHFHLLVWGVDAIDVHWLRDGWSEIVDTGDTIRVNIRRISSWRGAASYLAKDMAKVGVTDVPTGRVWGVINRAHLAVEIIRVDLTPEQFYRLRRVMRSWLRRRLDKHKLSWARRRWDGLTCYIPYEAGLRLLSWVSVDAP